MNNSSSVAHYPPPPGRTASRPVMFWVAAVVGLPAFIGAAAYFTITGMWARDNYRILVGLTLGAAIIVGAINALHTSHSSRQLRPNMATVQSSAGHTRLASTREALALHISLMIVLSLVGISVAIGMWTGWGDLPTTAGQRIFLPPGFAILGAAALIDAIATLVASRRGPILLTPTEIVRHQYWISTTIRWQSIDGVQPGARLNVNSRGLVFVTRKHHGARQFQAYALGIGVPAFYWLLDFYTRHPELRGELADERAIERIRNGSTIGRAGWISHA